MSVVKDSPQITLSPRQKKRAISESIITYLAREQINHLYDQTISLDDLTIVRPLHGKPYIVLVNKNLKDISPIDFSISYSDQLTVVTTMTSSNGSAVGIDIEKIRNYKPFVMNAFTTKAERTYLESMSIDRRITTISLIWTVKEAFLKSIGTGLRVHPNRVNVTFNEKQDEVSLTLDGRPVKVDIYFTFETKDYIITRVITKIETWMKN
jgi:phosphopantetheine--protein transferase-like protein